MPTHRAHKGLLVVFEGIDGAGKTTQCDLLLNRLERAGQTVCRLREPTDGPYGQRIRQLAQSGREGVSVEDEMALFIADRRENVERNIRPALKRGEVVVLDRYYYSTIAYQGARGMNPGLIRQQNEAFAPPADVLLYLRIPAEKTAERIEQGRGMERDLFEKEEYLREVAAIFDAMPDSQMVRVDATAPPIAVGDACWDAIAPHLPEAVNAHAEDA